MSLLRRIAAIMLAFGPAPAETSLKPEPIEVPQPLEDPQPVAA